MFLLLLTVSLTYAQTIPSPDHIVVVIEENHAYDQIIGSSAAPYINSLVADTLSALFTNSFGITHPSQPNYLWLFSGDNQGVTDDNPPADTPFTTLNIGAELLNTGKTFAGYSEDLPYAGYQGSSSGAYARKHNPWVNWQDGSINGIPWNLNEPLTSFPNDYNTLPIVSFVVPNQNHDMHNGSDPARITAGDSWLQNHMDGYIQWAKTHNSLVILTFDEDDTNNSNWILTLFIGEMVKDGEFNQSINHLNILRTLEDMYGLSYAGSSGDSSAISDCWRNAVPVELTLFTGTYNGNNVSLNWSTATETNNSGFEVQRRELEKRNHFSQWQSISFVRGNGTTAEKHFYDFIDNTLNKSVPEYQYRLKQIDFNGVFSYSKIVEIEINQPDKFELLQNYPNPFNPATIISWQSPINGLQTLKVYNALGKEVATLVNENRPAGNYEVKFDGKDLPSGVYLYRLQAGNFTSVKKMILMK